MKHNKTLLIFQALIFSLYLTWWYGCCIPGTIDSGLSEYWHEGLLGFVFFGASAISIYLDYQLKKWVYIIGLLALLSCTVVLHLFLSTDVVVRLILFILISTLQGLIAYAFMTKWYQPAFKTNLLHLLLLGISLVSIPNFMQQEFFNAENETNYNFVFYLQVLLIFLLIVTEFFRKEEASSITYKQASLDQHQKGINLAVFALAMIFVALEISFIYWSLVLNHDNQGVITGLTFPLTLILVFLWRMILNKFIHKLSDLGWMFLLTLVLTFSIGLFYTFSFTLPFMFGFSFSIATLICIHNRIFSFAWDKNRMAVVLLICALSSLICGFYIQNHIDFIKSIDMPDDVLILSARQAIIKEFASFAGLAVVLTGYLFLKRRSIFKYKN
ncbi:MAG: hypothetical protein KA341_06170 [Saprospiraceae bacterium]|nr:hypothetical protein [Saprospiraceae bacterium]